MTYAASTTPDITESLPFLFSARKASIAAASRGVLFDVTIGGVGFIACTGKQHPQVRQSAPIQKQQFDSSPEPGEQTLTNYWVRSQTSWHNGAGADFYEPGSRDDVNISSRFRFSDSVGVDVWTRGQATLLKKTTLAKAGTGSDYLEAAVLPSGTNAVFSTAGATLTRIEESGTTQDYTGFTSGPQTRVAVTGTQVLAGDSDGLYSGATDGTSASALWTQATNTPPTPWWVKSRIFAARGADLYELTLAGGDLDAQTAIYTHPDSGWTWTAAAEAPSAILVAGYGGGQSTIYRFTLTSTGSGSAPTLSSAIPVTDLPPGEQIHSMKVYLGRYVGIGTSAGLRIGVTDDTGKLDYGPLIIETANPVQDLGARGSFLYAGITDGISGDSGAARVDLGNPLDSNNLIFPWAFDAQTHTTGAVTGLSFIGTTDRVVIGVTDAGTYVQSATEYEASGTLTSGRIRFGTTEPKAFRLADLRSTTEATTSVHLDAVVGSSTLSLYTASSNVSGSDISLAQVPDKTSDVSYKVTLATTTSTKTPVLDSVSIKALPSPRRQWMYRYDLFATDGAEDAAGNRVGSEGYGQAQLDALFELEASQTVVQIIERDTGHQYDATVETVTATNDSPPQTRSGKGREAIVQLTVKTL